MFMNGQWEWDIRKNSLNPEARKRGITEFPFCDYESNYFLTGLNLTRPLRTYPRGYNYISAYHTYKSTAETESVIVLLQPNQEKCASEGY